MKEWFKDKKLLVLGGKPSGSTDIVEYAKSMGAYVIVADYLNQDVSPAKQLADEAWLVSTDDVDTLARLARENGVNRVFTGVHEFNISKALDLAERLELPFYVTRDQWEICSNKDRFKRLCMDFGIPVTQAYEDFDIRNFREFDNIEYPIIIKPVDSSGGRGIFICYNANELENNYEKSLSYSKSKKVIVEQYVTAEEVTLHYIAQDGEIILIMMADRRLQHLWRGLMPLPVAFEFPSKYLDLYLETMDHKVKKMFKSIGIRNGIFFIQSFCDGNQFTFYEMGLRINGNLPYKITKVIDGLNSMEMLVNYSMSGKMYDRPLKDLVNPHYDRRAAVLSVFTTSGEIKNISGVDDVKLMDGVIDVLMIHREGKRIMEEDIGTLKQRVMIIYVMVNTEKELQELKDRIHNTIKIYSTEGQNMVL